MLSCGCCLSYLLWGSIDVECLRWILTAVTPTIRNKTHFNRQNDNGPEKHILDVSPRA